MKDNNQEKLIPQVAIDFSIAHLPILVRFKTKATVGAGCGPYCAIDN
jgi:hypothetical protein